MKRIFLAFCFLGAAVSCAFAEFTGSNQMMEGITGAARLETGGYSGAAALWVKLQGGGVFAWVTLGAAVATILAFSIHYAIIGARHYKHGGTKVLAFPLYQRVIHAVAALSWVVLVPTGLIMMFGSTFGGGTFVRFCKNAHIIANFAFCVAVLPMFFMFVGRMLPSLLDIKWLMMGGGYLSKKNVVVPAGKFNAGQKQWFYVAIFGGLTMIVSGLSMFMLSPDVESLRVLAIVHNVGAVVCIAMFITHLYMTLFAIKGAAGSMIHGYMEEDEIYHLHNEWHKELKKKGKL